MVLLIYTLQLILGTTLWRRFKFSWSDSVLFSLMLLPTIILVSIFTVDFFFKFFARKNKEEDVIKCIGNNGNGCFMDSCGHDCGCEGLQEFGETLKSKSL